MPSPSRRRRRYGTVAGLGNVDSNEVYPATKELPVRGRHGHYVPSRLQAVISRGKSAQSGGGNNRLGSQTAFLRRRGATTVPRIVHSTPIKIYKQISFPSFKLFKTIKFSDLIWTNKRCYFRQLKTLLILLIVCTKVLSTLAGDSFYSQTSISPQICALLSVYFVAVVIISEDLYDKNALYNAESEAAALFLIKILVQILHSLQSLHKFIPVRITEYRCIRM